MEITVADHFSLITTLIRAVSLGAAAFLFSTIVRAGLLWWHLPPPYRLRRRQVGVMLAGLTLLIGGIVINHFVFVFRDEPFHYGTILMVPGYFAIALSMIRLSNDLLRGEGANADRPDQHQ